MSAGQQAQSHYIDVLLQRCLYNLFHRLTQAGINNLETCIAQSASHDFCAAVMTVKARFSY